MRGGEHLKAATRAKNKYNESAYDRISLFVIKGKKEIIKNRAEKLGLSLNNFINQAIDDKLKEE